MGRNLQRVRLLAVAAALACCVAAKPVRAERLALIIGNANYAAAGTLKNPVNDARVIEERLKVLHFETTRVENLRKAQIGRTIQAFLASIHPGDDVVFFYAGHGLQVKGINYLPAVDADIQTEDDVALNSLNLNSLLEHLEEAKAGVKLLFLDACRNNPFVRPYRGWDRGLAPLREAAASGTLIQYATRPGSVAADGNGGNGLYTSQLLAALENAHEPVEQTLKRVAAGVYRASNGEQDPWVEGHLNGDFCFADCANQSAGESGTASIPNARPVHVASPDEVEQQLWDTIRDSTDPAPFEDYLRQYPSGKFVAIARALIYTLSQTTQEPNSGKTTANDKSIAVLPFADMSEHHDQEYFSDGLSEELIERLSRSPDLKVIARTSSFYFKGKQATIGEIARALQVSTVLEGSVRKSRRTIRVTVQLIRASDGAHLWSQTYDKMPDDIFKVQDEIAATVARALQAALAGQINRAQAKESNTEAYNLFLQGRFFDMRVNKADSFRAIEFYRKAIQLDPNYARAWAGLANAYNNQAITGWIPIAQGIRKAREAVAQALRIDPNLASAHRVLGNLHSDFDWDWAAARKELEQARELDPGDLINDAHLARVGEFLFGRFDNFISLERQLIARDPLDTGSRYLLGLGLFYAGRYEQAADALRQLLVINASSAGTQALLGVDLLYLGRNEEALAAVQMEYDEAGRLTTLPLVYWAMGRRAESDAALNECKKKFPGGNPYSIAQAHAYRGEADAALEWLERGYRLRDSNMQFLRADPLLRSLHADPRYRALLVRMKLHGDGPDTQN